MGTNLGDPAAKSNRHRQAIGASAVIFDCRGRVLLIRRAKPPLAGLWSLPGGHIDAGETSDRTARREVREETGIDVVILGFLQTFDVPLRDAAGRMLSEMPLDVFYGRQAGDATPIAGDDAGDCRYVALGDLRAYPLTEACEDLVRAAWQRLADEA